MNTRTVLLWHNNGEERIYFTVNPARIAVSRPNRNRVLPLAMGACTALGGNVVTDAFGVVALVALAPPVAIQIMGALYVHRSKAVAQNKADLLSDDGVIDLEDEEI